MHTVDHTFSLNEPTPDFVRAHAHRIVNSATFGDLDIHFSSRTVRYHLNGHTALCLNASLGEEATSGAARAHGWTATCDPRTTAATARITTLQRDSVLSTDWQPTRIEVRDGAQSELLEAAMIIVDAEPGALADDSNEEVADAAAVVARDLFESTGATFAPESEREPDGPEVATAEDSKAQHNASGSNDVD